MGSDGRLPIPPVLREGHPEPAIDDRGGLERVVGKVRMAGHREATQQRSSRQREREREREREGGREAEWLDGSLTQGGYSWLGCHPVHAVRRSHGCGVTAGPGG
jgi:hypothetical protein